MKRKTQATAIPIPIIVSLMRKPPT